MPNRFEPMWKRFTPEAREAFRRAQQIAGDADVATEHLLAALAACRQSETAPIPASVREALTGSDRTGDIGKRAREQHLAEAAHRAVDRAYHEAANEGATEIGVKHLLLGLLDR